jgi:hypothetical protein
MFVLRVSLELGSQIFAGVFVLVLFAGSGGVSAQESASPDSGLGDLAAARVLFPTSDDWWVQLEDGGYREADEHGSEVRIWIEDSAFGDLDGDGAGDAAAILVWNGGGSEFFHSLAAFLPGESGPEHVATVRIFSPVEVLDLRIVSDSILLEVRVPATTARAGRFLLAHTRVFRLAGHHLEEISDGYPLFASTMDVLSCVYRDARLHVERHGNLDGYAADPATLASSYPGMQEPDEFAAIGSGQSLYACAAFSGGSSSYELTWEADGDELPYITRQRNSGGLTQCPGRDN